MEDIISMRLSSVNLFIIGLAILAIFVCFYYQIDGFDSDPNAGTRGCDSSCTGYGYSKISGKRCCNVAVGRQYPKSQADCPSRTIFKAGAVESENYCAVCVTLANGNTECHSPGTYSTEIFSPGSINSVTSLTDVLEEQAKPAYLRELEQIYDEEVKKDKDNSSKDRDLYSKDLSLLDNTPWNTRWLSSSNNSSSNTESNSSGANGRSGTHSGSWSNNNYWLNGNSGSKGGDWDENPKASQDNKNTKLPEDNEALDALIDNRLKSCKKLMDRTFERPSEEEYDSGAKKGNDTCKKYMSCNNQEEDNVCEGFSPLL